MRSVSASSATPLRKVGMLAAACCLVLASAACSERDAGQPESAAVPAASDPQPEQQAAAGDAPRKIGSMSIDGRSYDLVRAFWCEPGPGVERGTELAIKVGALHEDGRLIHVSGTQVDRDRDRPSVQQVSASEPGTSSYYQSGTVMLKGRTEPILVVEDGHVRIQGDVSGAGEVVPLEVEFALPEAPDTVPGAC